MRNAYCITYYIRMYRLALNSVRLSAERPVIELTSFLYFSTEILKIACFSLFFNSLNFGFYVNSVKNLSLLLAD